MVASTVISVACSGSASGSSLISALGSVRGAAAARMEESGVTEASGVSNCESPSTEAAKSDTRGLRPRFFGTVFEGEGARAPSVAGEKTCVGSSDSVARGRRRAAGLGVAVSSAAAARRGRPRPRPVLSGAGAGVNSSSSSSSSNSGDGVLFSSPSDSSTMGAFRRVAAARVDLRGAAEGIISCTLAVWLVDRRDCLLSVSWRGEWATVLACCVYDARANNPRAKTCLTPRQHI